MRQNPKNRAQNNATAYFLGFYWTLQTLSRCGTGRMPTDSTGDSDRAQLRDVGAKKVENRRAAWQEGENKCICASNRQSGIVNHE
jgi:hypothetical protein